jgi:hypothetical protein
MRKKEMKAAADTASAYKKRVVTKTLMTESIDDDVQHLSKSCEDQSPGPTADNTNILSEEFMNLSPEQRHELLQNTIERLELRNEEKAEKLRRSRQVPKTAFTLRPVRLLNHYRRNRPILSSSFR